MSTVSQIFMKRYLICASLTIYFSACEILYVIMIIHHMQVQLPTSSCADKSYLWRCKHLGRYSYGQRLVLFRRIILSNIYPKKFLQQRVLVVNVASTCLLDVYFTTWCPMSYKILPVHTSRFTFVDL